MNTNNSQTFSWKKGILLSLGAALLVLGLSVTLQAHGAIAQDLIAVNPKPAAAPAAVGLGSSYQAPGQPVKLIIPSIGVNAPIESVGLAASGDGEMAVPPNATDVAWYKNGPLPGSPGSAVIDGHLDTKLVQQAVFYNLGTLKKGDLVKVVDSKGKTLTFKVTDTKLYNYTDPTPDIFSSNDVQAHLNLITCGGDWLKDKKSYDKRVVVFTELVTN